MASRASPLQQYFERNPPGKTKESKAKIKATDVLQIVTPRRNYFMPGVFKNAIDHRGWRPYEDN